MSLPGPIKANKAPSKGGGKEGGCLSVRLGKILINNLGWRNTLGGLHVQYGVDLF